MPAAATIAPCNYFRPVAASYTHTPRASLAMAPTYSAENPADLQSYRRGLFSPSSTHFLSSASSSDIVSCPYLPTSSFIASVAVVANILQRHSIIRARSHFIANVGFFSFPSQVLPGMTLLTRR